MQPLVPRRAVLRGGCSTEAQVWSTHRRAWRPVGTGVRFRENEDKRGASVSWEFVWEFGDGEVLFFAYCYPYPYSFLQRFLAALAADPERSRCVRRKTLATTLGGLRCDLLEVAEKKK